MLFLSQSQSHSLMSKEDNPNEIMKAISASPSSPTVSYPLDLATTQATILSLSFHFLPPYLSLSLSLSCSLTHKTHDGNRHCSQQVAHTLHQHKMQHHQYPLNSSLKEATTHVQHPPPQPRNT